MFRIAQGGRYGAAEYRLPHWLHVIVVFVLTATMLASTTPPRVFALSSGDVTFSLITPFLAQDSNDSCAAGPKASYIEVLVTNPVGGAGALSNLTASLSAFAGAAGVTLDAGESATRYIGNLADGASFPLYFYVNYPCVAVLNPMGSTSTFTVTVSDGVTASLTSGTETLTTRSEISANAGGQVLSSTIGPGAVIGQIIPMTVQYDFGNPGGAQLAMIQPAGNVNFDSSCFRLISVDITAVTGFTSGLTTSADNQLYFTGVNGASSNTATVVYYFKMLCSGASTTANPFSDLTSGGQLKYTGNFGFCSGANAVCPVYPPPTNPFTISKSVSPTNLPTGGTATYTVVINNPSSYATTIDEIVDVLPAGLTFAALGGASQVTAANSSSMPAAGASGTLTFQGVPTSSCVGGTCNGSYNIAANSSLTLVYTVSVPNSAGSYTNSASATIGSSSIGPSTATTTVGTPAITLSKSDGGATTTPGGTVVYALTYQNTGTLPLTGVLLNETVPTNTTFNAAGSAAGWSCSGASAGSTCMLTIGPLAVGVSGSANFAVNVITPVPAGTALISNAASVTSTQGASAPATDTTPLTTAPALSLAKSDGGVSTTPGGTVVYALGYTNSGNVGLTGVQLNETVPTNTTFNAASSAVGWSCSGASAGSTCTLTIGPLAGGASGSANFAVNVITPVPAGTTQISNAASASANGGTTANASDSTPVNASPALSLSKSDGGTTITPGGTIAYTLSYANTGNIDLAGVTLTEIVPANTTFRSLGSTAGWSCADGAAAGTSCTLNIVGTLAGGASGSATFVVRVVTPVSAGTTQIVNSATIASGATSTTAGDTTPVNTTPGLSITKTDGNISTTPGGSVTYTIDYQNTGNIALNSVVINEQVPGNTTFRSLGSTAGWSCANGAAAGATCTLTIGPLAGSAAGSATFAVDVITPVPFGTTQLVNGVTITNGTTSASNADTTPVNTIPGLSLTKSDGNISAAPGGIVVYTLGYQNTGNVGLNGVLLTEQVPANTTFDAAGSSGGWSCTNGDPAGSICTLLVGGLAGGAIGTDTFAVKIVNVVPVGTTQISNAATITANGGTNATANDTTPVTISAALSLSKSDGGASVVPGGTVAYTLGYANTGNVDLDAVVLTETVPANATFSAVGSAAGWSCANGDPAGASCAFIIGNLAGGASGTLAFAVTVDTPLPAGVSQIANSAAIADSTTGANGSASDSTPVSATPALTLSKSDNGASTTPGGTVAYTLSYANTGNIGLTGVILQETVPTNTSFNAAASAPGWSCVGATCTLTIGNLAAGASASAIFAVTVANPVPAGMTLVANSASITNGATSANASDSTPVNSTPGLTLTKSDGGATSTPGGTVAYTLSYANTGNIGLTNLVLTETVPANTIFNAGSSSGGWSCANGSPAGASCTVAIGSLGAGASGSATFAVTVANPVPAGMIPISNVATIADGSGNSASNSDTTPVISTPGLTLTKSDGSAVATPGGAVAYTLSYANTGNIGLAGVILQETVPANAIFDATASTIGWSCPNGSPAGAACTLPIGNLAGSASGTVTFAVTVVSPVPAGTTQIANNATIGDGATDASAGDTTPIITAPGLSLNKSDGGASVTPGGTISYILSYANTGNIDLTGVALDETVPPDTTFNAVASTAGWSCVNGAAAGASCSLNVGGLAASASGTVNFAVTVLGAVPAGSTQLANTASISASGGASANASDTTPLTTAPALSLSKSDGGASVTPGGAVAYTLGYANTGNIGLTGVVLQETVPANTTFDLAASSGGWSCANGAAAGASCTLIIGSLAASASGAATFAVTVDATVPAGVTQIANSASVSDGTTSTNASDSTPVNTTPGLVLTKSDGNVSTTPGGAVVYTLGYANTGNIGLTSVVLTEAVPANTIFNAGSSTASWSCANGAPAGATCTFAIGNLAVGASGSVTFAVTVDATVPAGATQISNVATIADDGGASASNSDTTPINTTPGLSLSKSDGNSSATPGNTAVYTLNYANTGNVGLNGVEIDEVVPAHTTYTTVGSTAGWNCTAGGVAGATCTFTIGVVPAGTSGALTFVVVLDTPWPSGVTQVANAATITSSTGANGSANDTTPVIFSPGLSLAKSDNNATATPGGTIVYALDFQNTGNVDLTGVTLNETVPANSSFNAAAGTAGWSCVQGAPAGVSCTLPIGNLAGGAGGTAIFAVTVDNPIPAGVNLISNSASISDGVTSATASDTTTVNTAPALSLSKSDGGGTIVPGGTLVYILSYANTGNIGLTGVVIDETVPANTTFDATASTAGWSCANGSAAGASCTLPIGNLAGGASGAANFALTVDNPVPAGVTQISNTAVATASGGTTASGSDTTPLITAPGLTITKSDGGVTITPGATVAYVLNYANSGNAGLTGVAIAEVVPADTTFNAAASTAGWSCANGSPAGASCTLMIGSLAAGAGGTATFAVAVDNPIPAGVTQIANSVTIADGVGNSASNSDTTPIISTPSLTLTKTDGKVTATPGSSVVYTLNYANSGNIGLTGVVIDETVPANTIFDAAGSTAGWSCAGGGTAGMACTLNVGALAGGATGSATFAITVIDPLGAGTSQLSNAATISGGGASGSGSATTPVTTAPALSLTKSDGGASSTPGGTVVYTLSYANTGNVNLDSVYLSEIVPTDTTFDAAGSTAGWNCANGAAAGTSCTLLIGTLPGGGGSGSAAFAVKVNNPLANGISQVDNTATVADSQAGVSQTGSDSTPVTAAPILSAQKIVTDLDGGATRPGHVLRYAITVQNTGNIAATGATFTDAIPAHTTYVAGSTTLNAAPIADAGGAMPYASSGPVNSPGALSGQINAGATATIAFQVTIDNPLPAGVTQVSNQAVVSANAVTSVFTNNPSTSPPGDPTTIAINNPTAIALASFTATHEGEQVVVRWVTTAEINTWGFQLYRSADGKRASAVRVTPQLIPGQGRGQGGASYSWADTGAAAGVTYTYWLVETEIGGATNEYGPAIASVRPAAMIYRLFMPLAAR